MNRRVLLVDDEPRVLAGYRRMLYRKFEVETASSGREALALIDAGDPYAVVVSDYRMPEMDGVTFLAETRRRSPDTVRMLLTGQADQAATIAAINEGDVFRYLSKPCPVERLESAIEAAVEQFRLVQAERELLEQTLSGSVEVLLEVLGLVDPDTYRASVRIKDFVSRVVTELGLDGAWEFELAAMLSQIGALTLPQSLLHKFQSGTQLRADEEALVDGHPEWAEGLLRRIPRLEHVAAMIGAQRHPPGNRPRSLDATDENDRVAMGAHLLHLAGEYEEALGSASGNIEAILHQMRTREGPAFRLAAIDAFERAAGARSTLVPAVVGLSELEPGMVLDQDVRLVDGRLLLPDGEGLTQARIERLARFDEGVGVEQPLRVLVPAAPPGTTASVSE